MPGRVPSDTARMTHDLRIGALAGGLLLVGVLAFGAGGCASTGERRGPDRTTVLPASADTAVAALVASPRHGEWEDAPAPAGDDAEVIRTWVSYPERSDAAPVVVVIHEIFGLTDWVRAVCDALAAEGYLAVAPDLLSGKGPGGGGTDAFPGDRVRSAIRDLGEAEVHARLDAVMAWARAKPAAADRAAVTGFCWGGSTTFAYATHQPDIEAAIVWYGTAPEEGARLARIEAPVLGLYGGDDARVTSTVEGTIAAMDRAEKVYVAEVYDNAGHGFLRQQQGRDGANLAAAGLAWSATLDFLHDELD